MATIRRFEDIDAWQAARVLTRYVYAASGQGAFAKDFGLRDQMRRAAVSTLSNIAEGFESRTRGLFIEFLGRAKGSCGELRAQSYVAQDAGYLSEKQLEELQKQCTKCSGQIARFMEYLRKSDKSVKEESASLKATG